jgi:diguanylate cyclase (GGDEF)-like protein
MLACIAVHAMASSVEFEIGPGSAIPTTPVLYVSAFLVPPSMLPLVVFCGLLISSLAARLRDPGRREGLAVLAASAWHCVGPAVVFALAHLTNPALEDLGIYALALLSQLTLDALSSWIRNCYGLGVPTRRLVDALAFTFLVDVLLAPLGIVCALSDDGTAAPLLFLLPQLALLAILQRDRRRQVDSAVLLGQAFVETADSARRDALTGLRNRLAWEEGLVQARDAGEAVGVVLLDADGLKIANDRHGHEMGDRLLSAIAQVVSACTSDDPTVTAARIGGDEFGILVRGPRAATTADLAEQVRRALLTAEAIDGVVPVAASLGFATALDPSRLDEILALADRGVYIDKGERRRTP